MTYGFIYGDKVLKEIVNKVNRIIDSNDRLFRFGADRFVLVIDNYLSTRQLTDTAERIVEIFKASYRAMSSINILMSKSV